MRIRALVLAVLFATAACSSPKPPDDDRRRARRAAADADRPAAGHRRRRRPAHTKTLSSDEFEGRGPGTKGEELTVEYLVDQFTKIGLKPGNTDGTYIQKVPLVGITPTARRSSSRRARSNSA